MEKRDIKELIKLFDSSSISKLKLKYHDIGIELEKNIATAIGNITEQVVLPASTSVAPAINTEKQVELESTQSDTINSPMVGTFYNSPSPEAPTFVKVGDIISQGDTLCILEAMKIMNEFEAEFDCKILEILVEDGSPVEYNMPMFKVEKI